MNVLEDLTFWSQQLPFMSLSALGAYVVLASFLVPSVRKWLSMRLAMPVPSTGIHLAPLDAFRGLSALLIVAYHCWNIPQPVFNDSASAIPFIRLGDKAVPVFCVLSGFLIYRSLRKVVRIEEIRAYVIRRVLRIYPLYVASVIACVLLGPLALRQALGELFMLQVFGFNSMTNAVIWSLYVEVLFYFILPMVVFSVDARGMLLFALCAFLILSLCDIGGLRTIQLWKYFLAGIIASELADRCAQMKMEWVALGTFAVGILLLVVDFRGVDWIGALLVRVPGIPHAPTMPPSSFTVGLALASIFIVVGSVTSASLDRLFGWTPFRVLGTISFSMFVWQGFIVAADFALTFDTRGGMFQTIPGGLDAWPRAPWWLMLVIPLPAVTFWSIVSFLLIERPFLLRRPRSAVPDTKAGRA